MVKSKSIATKTGRILGASWTIFSVSLFAIGCAIGVDKERQKLRRELTTW